MSSGGREVEMRIVVAEDGMTATLRLPAGLEDAALELGALGEALRSESIHISAEVKRVLTEIGEAYRAAGREARDVVFARGRAPEHGRDEAIAFEPGLDPRASAADHLAHSERPAEGGQSHSHYERSAFALVNRGQAIGRLTLATLGEDGQDVRGRSVAARPGRTLGLRVDASIEQRADGALVAAADGAVRLASGTLSVVSALEVRSFVDFSTGNIVFPGDVTVHKGVRDCFRVRCSGTLTVFGLVEAAGIDCGSDAWLRGGFAGREKGTVVVERDLTVKYADGVTGVVGRDLTVEKEIVNSQLTVGRRLVAQRGAVIGGRIHAAGSVEVDQLGSESGGETSLTLGTMPLVGALRSRLRHVRPAIDGRRTKASAEHDSLRKNASKLTPSQAERMTELQYELSQMAALAGKCERGMERLAAVESAHTRVELTVWGRIHAGVTLRLPRHEVAFGEEVRGPIRITIGEGGRPVATHLSSGSVTDLREIAKVVRFEAERPQGEAAA